jgi:hypothetical protein
MDDLELQLSKAGKGLQKLMKKHATDSDEEGSDREHNPYASSVSIILFCVYHTLESTISGRRRGRGTPGDPNGTCYPAAVGRFSSVEGRQAGCTSSYHGCPERQPAIDVPSDVTGCFEFRRSFSRCQACDRPEAVPAEALRWESRD